MIRVYGSRISYYTGKLEAYLRYRGIPYELLSMTRHRREIIEGAGAVQAPVARLEDGRWMSDTTPILAWLDGEQDGPSIYPSDPLLRFLSLLLEDYADEWLWRSAMHYRWSYRLSREYARGILTDELMEHVSLPRFVKERLIARRQLRGFVLGDGVTQATWDHVEQGYLRSLDLLEAIFAKRRFVLGDRPTIVDFGFVAPMLRHFSQDPTPAEIMRSRAPGVYAWVARMWNVHGESPRSSELLSKPDAGVVALLAEAAETHLAQLRANALAFAAGSGRYDQEIQGCAYRQVPTSRYRVWCLEELRRAWRELDEGTRNEAKQLIPELHGAVLWEDDVPAESGYDPDRKAPFNRAINVFGRGVPR